MDTLRDEVFPAFPRWRFLRRTSVAGNTPRRRDRREDGGNEPNSPAGGPVDSVARRGHQQVKLTQSMSCQAPGRP